MLAVLLGSRFGSSGDRADLDRVIYLHLEVLKTRPPSHPERYNTLINLGSSLHTQFGQTGQRKSLYDAITLLREAVNLVPSPSDSKCSALNALSSALRTRYEEETRKEDILEAIELQKEVMKYDSSVASVSTFVGILFSQYKPFTGNGALLDPMIEMCEKSLATCEPHYSPIVQSNLGNLLRLRYSEFQQLEDLTKAIQLLRQSTSSLSESHPVQCATCMALGGALFEMSTLTKDAIIMDEGAAAFRRAVDHPSAPTATKFIAARAWAEVADRHDHNSAMEACRSAIALLPLLAALNTGFESRLETLTSRSASTNDLAIMAAACALKGGDLMAAIELLEAGRAVFWNQALKLRPPMRDLEACHPDLASQFMRIGKDLEAGSFSTGKNADGMDGLSLSEDHVKSHQLETLSAEWQRTLEEIRLLPGFEDFLRPWRFADFSACCHDGPVVILFTNPAFTTAVMMNKDYTKHIQLDLTLKEASGLVKMIMSVRSIGANRTQLMESAIEDLRDTSLEDDFVFSSDRSMKVVQAHVPSASDVLADILQILWVKLVEPIIRTLGLKKSATPVRVHWCPTSILAFLPLHAAGLHGGTKTESTMDYMTSSYTPTLTALLGRSKDFIPSDESKMVVIVEPKSLPYSRGELVKIKEHIPSEILTTLGDTHSNPATISEVLRQLPTASIVHFACHGKQDARNPLNSALILEDGELSVMKIMQQEMRDPQLAFLSACETATGVLEVPDESMHIAASLLGAGFRGVVGTMWFIADQDGPKVADEFYRYLSGKDHEFREGQKSKLNTSEAARALHSAVQKLRSEGVPLHRWVPFIYVGK